MSQHVSAEARGLVRMELARIKKSPNGEPTAVQISININEIASNLWSRRLTDRQVTQLILAGKSAIPVIVSSLGCWVYPELRKLVLCNRTDSEFPDDTIEFRASIINADKRRIYHADFTTGIFISKHAIERFVEREGFKSQSLETIWSSIEPMIGIYSCMALMGTSNLVLIPTDKGAFFGGPLIAFFIDPTFRTKWTKSERLNESPPHPLFGPIVRTFRFATYVANDMLYDDQQVICESMRSILDNDTVRLECRKVIEILTLHKNVEWKSCKEECPVSFKLLSEMMASPAWKRLEVSSPAQELLALADVTQ